MNMYFPLANTNQKLTITLISYLFMAPLGCEVGNQDTHILSPVTLLILTFSGGRPGADIKNKR